MPLSGSERVTTAAHHDQLTVTASAGPEPALLQLHTADGAAPEP